MRSRKYARGEGKLGCIIWIVVLSVGGLILFRYVPKRVAVAELQDHMVDVCLAGAYSDEESMAKNILARAEELKLPIAAGDISVTKTRERIVMDVSFNMDIDLIVTQINKTYNLHEDRPYFK